MLALPPARARAPRPILRKLNAGLHVAFKDILLNGVLAPAGMERFDDILSEKDVDNIHAYLIDQSWIAYRAQETAAAHAQGTPASKPASGRPAGAPDK